MKIRAGFDIVFDSPQSTPHILLLNVHPSRRKDLITSDHLIFDPAVELETYVDVFGNICTRVLAPPGPFRVRTDFTIRDTGEPDRIAADAPFTPIEKLPSEALTFLVASRYCDTDVMAGMAWALFKNTTPGWPRVQAICDYVHQRLTFGYHHARSTRTASEGHKEGRGVCRDFAHLAVTLCRCMNIPARYCTGYLGDIGIPPVDAPMDFSAWFETFIDGQWYTFDARHNTPRIGRIVIARGRDAADVAISTSFGCHALTKFEIVTYELPDSVRTPLK